MSTDATIWFPYHIKDFRSETHRMSHAEKGVYVELWEMLWEAGGSTVADDKWLADELGLRPREWAAMRDKVLRHFSVKSGRLEHPRLTAELAKARANIEQKRKAGIASAAARKKATGVQRAFNGRTNGEATAGQPRAGGGEGEGTLAKDRYNTLEGQPIVYFEERRK